MVQRVRRVRQAAATDTLAARPVAGPIEPGGDMDGLVPGRKIGPLGFAGCDDGRVRVLMPLPDRDFDVTEVAVPWRILRDAGHEVVFATERAGTVPAADPRLLTGVIFGQLGAAPEPLRLYQALTGDPLLHRPTKLVERRAARFRRPAPARRARARDAAVPRLAGSATC